MGGPDIFKAIFSDRTAEVHVLTFQMAEISKYLKRRFKFIENCSMMQVVQTYSKQYSAIEQKKFMRIENCSLMRMVQTYSKQYSVIE